MSACPKHLYLLKKKKKRKKILWSFFEEEKFLENSTHHIQLQQTIIF